MKSFAMDLMSIPKPLVRPLLVLSGGRFDGRVAFRSAREAAFGPSGRPTAGFRRLGGRAQLWQKCRNHPTDSGRRQIAGSVASLPGQPPVAHTLAGQPQLSEGGHHQPTPSVSLLWMAYPRGGPSQCLFEKAEGVFQIEPTHICSPEKLEIRLSGSRPP